MTAGVTAIVTLLVFIAFCLNQLLHRHKFDRTLDAMIETQRFRGAKDAKEFSTGLERALKAVGEEPRFRPPNLNSGLGQLLARRKEPPSDKRN